MKLNLIIVFVLATTISIAQTKPKIYNKGWIDFNKNGKKDVYEDPLASQESRVQNLLQQMDLNEKTGQLATLYGYKTENLQDIYPTAAWKTAAWRYGVANIDEHCNDSWGNCPEAYPFNNRIKVGNAVQKWFIEETRLGIPVDFTNEGISGLAHTKATYFPKQIAQASTWNKTLVYKIGEITAKEGRSLGYTNIYSPILDLARDPRWGRVVETYGEDPYLAGQLGKQMVLGLQQNGVAATAKHFAVYSIPNGGRDGDARTNPQVPLHEMYSIYLEPFRVAVREANLQGVMVSYNDYDGVPLPANAYFLKDILRKQWGFTGYVVTDSEALEFVQTKHKVAADYQDAIKMCIEAGTNVRTFFKYPFDYYITPLREAAKAGKIDMNEINARVAEVLRVKFKSGLFDQPYVKDENGADKIIHTVASQAVSLQAARESIILLKNNNQTLPLKKNLKTIAVIGPNAAEDANLTHRYGPKGVSIVSVLNGIKAKMPTSNILYAKGSEHIDAHFPESDITDFPLDSIEKAMIAEAVKITQQADIAIVVLGDLIKKVIDPKDLNTVGEAYTRLSTNLPGSQEKLLKAVAATGKPVVLVLMNGRVMSVNWADKNIPAIVETWFLGEHTGVAIADVLFGDYNPGGKLPVTVPKAAAQVPMAFPYKPMANTSGPAEVNGPLYPFGYGLSYTTFKYANLKLNRLEIAKTDSLEVSVDITNTGNLHGDEVVQLYLKDELASIIPFDKMLRGFDRVHLKAGETKTLKFILSPYDFSMFDRQMNWVVEPGWFTVSIGASSTDVKLIQRMEIK